MKKLNKKQVIMLTITLLILLIGSTYAYFSIQASNNQTGAKVTGKANNLGNPTMQIKTSKLYLNLDANLMSQANAGKTYYANENESGLALETNPNYTLATAQLPEGDEALDCTYNYKVTATVTTPITDNSDNDVKVVVGDKTMTLKELTTAGTTGIIVSGEIKNLTKGQSVSIPLTSSVTNTANTQDNLVDNSYTIKIIPYTERDTKAFSCNKETKIDTAKTLAQNLIDSNSLWQSGIQTDGYRYVGKGAVGTTDNPNNFICFGTSDKDECLANQDKYMYRILGVFSDANGENHTKLIKYKQYTGAMYHNIMNNFKNDNNFAYINSGLWSNKITTWTYSIVNLNNGSSENRVGPKYSDFTPAQVLLHELHISSATSVESWATSTTKASMLYISDYFLSVGDEAKINEKVSTNSAFADSWLNPGNNDTSIRTIEWILPQYGVSFNDYNSIKFTLNADNGYETNGDLNTFPTRPVFYLNSDVKINKGSGTLNNPFIITE